MSISFGCSAEAAYGHVNSKRLSCCGVCEVLLVDLLSGAAPSQDWQSFISFHFRRSPYLHIFSSPMNDLHRPSTPPGMPPPSAHRKTSKLSFGTVCSSNINRSMEAHVVLQNAGEMMSADVHQKYRPCNFSLYLQFPTSS